MLQQDPHASDEELLRVLDGELTGRCASEIGEHLQACWSCRARMRELEGAIDEFIQSRRREIEARIPPPDAARALLRVRMRELAVSPDKPSWWRTLAASVRTRDAGLACVLLVVLAAVGLTTQRQGGWMLSVEARSTPDPRLTPGATLPVTREDVCSAGRVYAGRLISEPVARQVFAAYGIKRPAPGAYELDYLITPALGGDDNIRNFWPQPYGKTIWNAHLKDALEDHLHQLVCEGQIDLATAQSDIAKDWIAAYKKYFATSRPLPEHSTYLRDQPWE